MIKKNDLFLLNIFFNHDKYRIFDFLNNLNR